MFSRGSCLRLHWHRGQREQFLRYFPPTDDPEVLENREQIARGLLKVFPKLRDEMLEEARDHGLDEGKVEEARKAVERVLRRRGLAVSEAQAAQLAACHDLETLERWHDLAITAATADEALR
jgi:hypothetical protein